ncbi:MAG: amidohydrolase family protein, partial [Gemmatimonadetes bacterium]|nr:amidohydrolase family protein [Gemmatimonadota bacterium]
RWVLDGRFTADEPSGAPVIDLAGGWVIPPLADAHTHAVADTPDPAGEAAAFVASGILAIKNPNSTAAGVARGRAAIAGHTLPLQARFAGSGLTSPGGHPSQIYRAHGADDGWIAVDSPAALDREWNRLLAPQPDFLKIYLEESENHARIAADPEYVGRRGLDPALVPAIVARAEESGLEVSAHVRTAADFRTAVSAGVGEINHLPLEEISPADAEACAARGVRVVTTVLRHRPTRGVPDLAALHRRNVQRLWDAGVEIAFGTDNTQVDVIDEILAVQELGVLPADALIRAATTSSTRACLPPGQEPATLAAGDAATFLVLEEDPLADPAALRDLKWLFIDGERHKPAPRSEEPRSFVGPLMHKTMTEGVEAAVTAYRELRGTDPGGYDFSESQLNDLGYALLNHGAADEAVVILRLNTAEFPHSVNAWDSLAEAQAAAGERTGAAASSREVLRRLEEVHDIAPGFRKQLLEAATERIRAAE